MSSTVGFPFTVNADNCRNVLQSDGDVSIYSDSDSGLCAMSIRNTTIHYATLTNKDSLFPNSTATPTKIDASFVLLRDFQLLAAWRTYGYLYLDGAQKISVSSTSVSPSTQNGSTEEGLGSVKKSSSIQFGIRSGANTNRSYIQNVALTFYFTRYDFSAVAGTGVTSASVSSSTGYNGDTITFTASTQTGYAFDGWYNGSTKVSSSQTYVHTVAGADMTLTAKAIASTKTVTTKYGNTTIATEQRMPPVAVSYGTTQIVSISSGQTKTLNCLNNLMSSNLTVGGKTLLCANQIMNGNIIVSVS